MSATDELRRILNERGVEWESGLPTETIVREPNDALYVERPDGRMHVYFRSYLTPAQAVAATLGPCNCSNSERTDLAAENAALREQMERLVTLLRNDCDIDASWDGLRRFWSIELTEDGCLIRDRACKAEAENAKLREQNAKLRRGTTTRHAKYRTKYGRRVPLCECCGYSIGDMRWHFCPNCGAEVVDE